MMFLNVDSKVINLSTFLRSHTRAVVSVSVLLLCSVNYDTLNTCHRIVLYGTVKFSIGCTIDVIKTLELKFKNIKTRDRNFFLIFVGDE